MSQLVEKVIDTVLNAEAEEQVGVSTQKVSAITKCVKYLDLTAPRRKMKRLGKQWTF